MKLKERKPANNVKSFTICFRLSCCNNLLFSSFENFYLDIQCMLSTWYIIQDDGILEEPRIPSLVLKLQYFFTRFSHRKKVPHDYCFPLLRQRAINWSVNKSRRADMESPEMRFTTKRPINLHLNLIFKSQVTKSQFQSKSISFWKLTGK